MKKYFLLILITFSAVYPVAANPYSHFIDYDAKNKTFLKQIASHETATCVVCFADKTQKDLYRDDKIATQIFLDSLNDWFNTTKLYIQNSNRQEEFKDILEIIDDRSNIKHFPCPFYNESTNLGIFFDEELVKKKFNSAKAITVNYKMILINSDEELDVKYNEYKKLLSHELGHVWGLSEQYPGQIYRGSFLYNSRILRPSIMGDSEVITCDDVDGFITSIDRTLGKPRTFYSLCGDNLLIKDGQGFNENQKSYNFIDAYEDFDADVTVLYDEDSKDSYTVDIILTDFLLSEQTLNLVKSMGFEINDFDTLFMSVIKINARLQENGKEYRKQISPITATLYLKPDADLYITEYTNMEPIQTIQREITPDYQGVFTDLKTGNSYKKRIVIPIIDLMTTKVGHGEKIKSRSQYLLRRKIIQNNNFLKKQIENIDILVPFNPDKTN